jgi:hypothetical protein
VTIEEAIRILGTLYDPATRGLRPESQYVSWEPGDAEAVVDDRFTADELEAMAVVMRASHNTSA